MALSIPIHDVAGKYCQCPNHPGYVFKVEKALVYEPIHKVCGKPMLIIGGNLHSRLVIEEG